MRRVIPLLSRLHVPVGVASASWGAVQTTALKVGTPLIMRYYRETLCVSAVFAVAQCPSVCLSRSFILSRRLKISSNFFVVPVAPSF